MNTIFRCFMLLLVLTLLDATGMQIGNAQEPQFSAEGAGAGKQIELPQNPQAWLNSPPLSVASMRGKAMVLYFFEEDCPRCRERWPAILNAAAQMQSSPVILVGVNSGTSPGELRSYVQQNRISIPIIADYYRTFERAVGVNEVSLQNIFQAAIIDPEGNLQIANGADIPGTLQRAAAEAKWNIDPSQMPANLIPLWKQIEFGNYAGTSRLMQRALKDRTAEGQAAAEILQNYVNEQINGLLDKAQEAETARQCLGSLQILFADRLAIQWLRSGSSGL
ncbi:MAG: TlpA disulfide reductase family protein [Pirellulaceae bacterium]